MEVNMDEKVMDDVSPYYIEVFGNDVILRKFQKLIGVNELKALREVDKTLNRIVLEQSDFYARSVMVLDKHSMEDPLFLTSTMTPKHLMIFPFEISPTSEAESVNGDEDRIFQRISTIMENCEALTIWDQEKRESDDSLLPEHDPIHDWTDDFDDLDLPNLCPKILDVVRLGKGLKTLTLQGQAAMFLNKSTKEDGLLLPNLTCIEYLGIGRIYIPKLLTGITGMERLRTSGYRSTSDFMDGSDDEAFRFIEFLKNNKETLTDLGYRVNISKFKGLYTNQAEFTNRTFPNLKVLKLQIYECQDVNDILLAHNNTLEEIRMNVNCNTLGREDGGDDQTDFEPILQTLCTNLPKLKVLELDVCHFLTITRKFARDFKKLQLDELVLKNSTWNASQMGPVVYTDVFSCLPVCLKRLYMNGQLSMSVRLGLDSSELVNFSALRELELIALESLRNEFVQQICKHLTSLRVLKIADNKKITDAAFLGSKNKQGEIHPLQNLKRLEILELSGLGITEATALQGIWFMNLKHLVLGGMNFKRAVLRQVVRQNPLLKKVSSRDPGSVFMKDMNKLIL